MNTIITILLVSGRYHCLAVTHCAFYEAEHYVKREIIINAPRQKVFDYLKLLKNQDEFNKHAMAGSDRKENSKEQTEQLDLFMPGAEIKMPV
jgi:hypothetical protein